MNRLEVTTAEEGARLNDWLLSYPGPVGLDLETTSWSPGDKLSPVGRARVWCLSLAWGSNENRTSCFVPATFLGLLRPWLESEVPQKVGTNLLGFDTHALANEGIALGGILGDTVVMSRLLDSRPELDDGQGHGLEAWGERVGQPKSEAFEDLVTVTLLRTVPGKVRAYKDSRRLGVLYGGEAQAVAFKEVTEEWALDRVWREMPERRERIVTYACADPVASLAVFERLKKELEGRRW